MSLAHHAPLTYNNATYSVEVLKVENLPFPILLGRDMPAFGTLVRSSLPRLAAVMDEEEQPGCSGVQMDEPQMQPPAWDADKDFLRMKETNPTLMFAKANIVIEDDQTLDACKAARLPRFEKVRGVLWQIAGLEWDGDLPLRQLVVSKPYRARVHQQAHGHLWVGHQGHIHTLSRLLGSFFWPSASQDMQHLCRNYEQFSGLPSGDPRRHPFNPCH